MFTYKFVGLDPADATTPYYYGSLPAKPEVGHILVYDDTKNRYEVIGIDGEGLVGDGPTNQRELAFADIGAGKPVPTLLLRKLAAIALVPSAKEQKPSGRSWDADEVKKYSQENRKTRLSASAEEKKEK
jgi:hypothetical protein